MTRFILLAFFLTTPVPGFASDAELFQLIDARLELMDEVAAYKWHARRAIEDPDREQVVLENATAAALRHGLEPAGSRVFFQLQIEAAKEIQQYWFERYAAGQAPRAAADLDTVTRPQLLDLGDRITRLLGARGPVDEARKSGFLAAVRVEGLSEATTLALFRSLTEVAHFADRLQQILDTGELRVGTTGDYPPFSLHTEAGYRGIDIDMANDLAAALGVKLTLVSTSWPTLTRDLAEGRFDVAMSGVSRSTERQKTGFLSTPYYHGGKSPIARCADAEKFGSLAAIDDPSVRVIVNPGGTNQAFVTSNIHRARVIVYGDNTGIFDRIIAGEADVMITDAIEVTLQAARHAELCATMPGKFLSYLDKAYLMPADVRLKEYVDTWLELRLADGTVRRVFSRHMP